MSYLGWWFLEEFFPPLDFPTPIGFFGILPDLFYGPFYYLYHIQELSSWPIICANGLFWMVIGAILFKPSGARPHARRLILVALAGLFVGLALGHFAGKTEERLHPGSDKRPGQPQWCDRFTQVAGFPGVAAAALCGDPFYWEYWDGDTPEITYFNGLFWMALASAGLLVFDSLRLPKMRHLDLNAT